jgi:WS/DGAT/MGAT family acyltransferase
MAQNIQFENRMSDSDALMWKIEKDPLLRSTITAVWLLDRSPDPERLASKIERATRVIPRLRERVVSNPVSIAPPRFEVDRNFDLAFHVRWMRAPGDGSIRSLLDMAQPMAMQGFDRARPLWELAIVEGLTNGRAAMIMKLHHSISDGVGLVQMTSSLVERYRTPDPKREAKPMPAAPHAHEMSQWERFWDALAHEQRQQRGRARRAIGLLGRAAVRPTSTARAVIRTGTSMGRLLRPVTRPLSPVMTSRSLSLRFDVVRVPLEPMKLAAKRAGGTLNDAFVAAVMGGLRLYHEAHARPVRELRMTMPINMRSERTAHVAGNQFAPARLTVPVGITDAHERINAVAALVRGQRGEAALPLLEEVSGLFNRLPSAIATAMFGAMLKGIDFVTSNVPGPPFETFVSGARVDEIYGFGPLGGAAVNVTLFSYDGTLGFAINSDRSAVVDPLLLRACIEAGVQEVLTGKPERPPQTGEGGGRDYRDRTGAVNAAVAGEIQR